MPTYTTNKGRVLTAIIYDGTNSSEIDALLGFNAAEPAEERLLITTSNNSQFYAVIGDYIVYNSTSFVEIMDNTNF
jgi:hypothetical protein